MSLGPAAQVCDLLQYNYITFSRGKTNARRMALIWWQLKTLCRETDLWCFPLNGSVVYPQHKDTRTKQTSTSNWRWTQHPTHKVNGSEAAMANLTEVSEQLLWIIFAEQICHIGVFEIARPCTRGHGQGLEDRRGHGSGRWHRGDQEILPGYIAGGRFQTESLHLFNNCLTKREIWKPSKKPYFCLQKKKNI